MKPEAGVRVLLETRYLTDGRVAGTQTDGGVGRRNPPGAWGGGALGYNCATPGAGKEVHPVPRGEESKNHCPQHLVGVTHIF